MIINKNYLIICILFFINYFFGCALKAPDVNLQVPSLTKLKTSSELCEAVMNIGDCGVVSVPMQTLAKRKGHWIYWKAGEPDVDLAASDEKMTSLNWDMRVTEDFPIVGCNGGKTATDEGHPEGAAAFAVWNETGFPRSVDQVLGLNYVADVYDVLTFKKARIGPEYQNPLVNTIGSGLLSEYDLDHHIPKLSRRVFILRTANGLEYYALRFHFYSRAQMLAGFEWRKLK